jgi:hypothetical protein
MKQIIISVAIGCLIATGLSQSPTKNDNKDNKPSYGLKVKPVKVERDFYEKMQRSAEKKKIKSFDFQPGTKAVVREMENPNTKVKYQSTANPKPKQNVNNNSSTTFRKGNGQIYTRTKARKKLSRVEGFAPREEMKKIDSHPQISEEVLMRALGNATRIKKQSDKTK